MNDSLPENFVISLVLYFISVVRDIHLLGDDPDAEIAIKRLESDLCLEREMLDGLEIKVFHLSQLFDTL
jgi:hypothetical protein